MPTFKPWLQVRKEGLYCIPGQFYIDPLYPVDNAIITHGHADHARSGHKTVIAHPATMGIMKIRYGDAYAQVFNPLSYHQTLKINEVTIYLLPAGHILGSAQVVMEFNHQRIIASGDYKRRFDPTCELFEVLPCDVFITEATFSLPVFIHPPIEEELHTLLLSLSTFPERCHLIGVYALGKCQRVIKTLRLLGYEEPIYIHGALVKLCNYYSTLGIELGPILPASSLDLTSSKGKIVLCPPSALHDRWCRRFANVKTCLASGWMQIRARAKQKGIDLPLIISDHADWHELIQTIHEINPKEVWVTHGREDALVHYCQQNGFKAQALHLIGLEEGEE